MAVYKIAERSILLSFFNFNQSIIALVLELMLKSNFLKFSIFYWFTNIEFRCDHFILFEGHFYEEIFANFDRRHNAIQQNLDKILIPFCTDNSHAWREKVTNTFEGRPAIRR